MWGHGGVYAEWVTYLDRFARGQEAGLSLPPRIEPGDLDSDTMARLGNHLHDALSGRIDSWVAALNRAINTASGEFALGRALAQGRDGLRSLLAFADHAPLPEELRGQLRQIVERQVRTAQESLEQDVGRVTTQHSERMLRIVRENRLTAVLTPPTLPRPVPGDSSSGSPEGAAAGFVRPRVLGL